MAFITFRQIPENYIIVPNENNILEKFNKIIRWIRARVPGLPFGYDSLYYPTPGLP
jgi:hypothetical protein